MTDISAVDPYGQPGGPGGPSTLSDVLPEGGNITLNPDGSGDFTLPENDEPTVDTVPHFANLAEVLDEARMNILCNDLLDAIKIDKEARAKRDTQYDEGLRRTGLGDDAPGGAQFNGASRAVHPLLTEAAVDFAAGVMNEMLPPDGPVKAQIIGEETDEKNERALRVARWMNYQITELMPAAYHEFEVGFTQCPLGGAFYTKMYLDNDVPAVSFIPIDHVYRPWTDGDFYSSVRITHRQMTDKWTFKDNVRRNLWRDVVDPSESAALPEETAAGQSNDRIIGRDEPIQNIDAVREVYEVSVILPLKDEEDELLPYLYTIDVASRKTLSIYRNWKEDDVQRGRLDFLIEWPFWPWRGGYPIGMTHMIGGLSLAATGALRALLDAAHLNNSQTGVRLKGGATVGGQNVQPQQTQVAEISGSLAQDDIRKTYMALPFNPPSPTLFNLLGFLVDAGRGVVRTTFDEYDKFSGNTPVGTAQMFIEQGMKNFGAVHGRLHRSMRRFLKQLYNINSVTINDATVIDAMGELTVSAADFNGPMCIIPISDPRIFSDMQRKAQAQTISARATQTQAAGLNLYDQRKAESNFLRQMGVSKPDDYLVKIPQPTRLNAAAENVTASSGQPIKAFPGQDHEAHIQVHMGFMNSALFGQNPVIALKFLPIMLDHLADHVSQWYADAVLEAANAAIQAMTHDPSVTVQSLTVDGAEAPLDRLLAQLTPTVIEQADEHLKGVPAAIAAAQALIKRLQPPTPMDPSVVAMHDVNRQERADEMQGKIKLVDIQARSKGMELKAQADQLRMEQDQRKAQIDEAKARVELQTAEDEAQERAAAADHERAMAEADVHLEHERNMVTRANNEDTNETAITIEEMKEKHQKSMPKPVAPSASPPKSKASS